MARILIWPDLYKEHGHWLPTVNLAKTLQDAGHAVEFMGTADTAAIVEPYGGTFSEILADIYPVGHSVENHLEPEEQRWKPHHLLPITRGVLDSVFQRPSNPPELLIAGYFTALETLLIHYLYDIPIVIITTYLRHPYDEPAQHALTKLHYMSKAMQNKLMDAVLTPQEREGMTVEAFVQPLRDAREIIPCPGAFDFDDDDWKHRERTTYVEPMIAREHLAGGQLPEDPVAIDPGSSTRLIFATSGSQVQDYEFQARAFFKDLISMMKTEGMEDAHLVLAAGERLKAQLEMEYKIDIGKSTLPDNVSLFSWVSQLEVLKAAEVVFMHGGLATIKESIWEQVPIVLVPHGKDQSDNALRIKRAGVGVVTQVEDLTPLRLRKYLTMATSSTWIEKNLANFRGLFEQFENATEKESLKVINEVLNP